jgi:hypothetical protein
VELGKFRWSFLVRSSSDTFEPNVVTATDFVSRAGLCFLSIIYTYFRMPEPKDRSFAELDLLFEKGIPARKFAQTKVNVFEETSVEGTTVFTQYEEKVADAVRRNESLSGSKFA